MRKLLFLITFSLFFVMLGSNSVMAEEVTINNDDAFLKSIELNLLEIGENGTVNYIGDKEDLDLTEEEYAEFRHKIDSLNYLIDKGYATVDSSFNVDVANQEEAMEITESKSSTPMATPYDVNPGHPELALNSLVRGNRQEIEDTYYAAEAITNPASARSSTIGIFAALVREGGDWDYKVQPGFSPWDKKFYAYKFDGPEVVTSEYIGNYNYAFVGEFLFNLSTLYIGGGAIGDGVGEDKDRGYIRDGYYDAVNHW